MLKKKTIFFIAFVSFAYGIVTATYNLFPYSALRYGYKAAQHLLTKEETRSSGFWHVARQMEDEAISDEQREGIEKLASLPYLRGSKAAKDVQDVTIYDKTFAQDGFNFYVSGHGPEAFLLDMQGNLLHKWRYAYEEIWPDELPFDEWEIHKTFWRRAHLFANGDVLAVFEGIGLVKIDKDSKLLWAKQIRSHHDVFVDGQEQIYTLTRRWRQEHDKLSFEGKYLEDFVTVLSMEGREIRKVSVLESFLNSDYASLLINTARKGDILHTNTVEVIDSQVAATSPMFKEGNVLISSPTLHVIAVIDMELEKVVWALSGMWKYQHQPTLLNNGNILLFDNLGDGGKSKVVEFNPLTQNVVWAYRSTLENEFLSKTSGSNQRLANGNTLITESNNGRAFEVTPDKEIVWEFMNPFRAGDKKELVATLFEVVRLNNSMFADETWLDIATGTN